MEVGEKCWRWAQKRRLQCSVCCWACLLIPILQSEQYYTTSVGRGTCKYISLESGIWSHSVIPPIISTILIAFILSVVLNLWNSLHPLENMNKLRFFPTGEEGRKSTWKNSGTSFWSTGQLITSVCLNFSGREWQSLLHKVLQRTK